MKVFVSWSGGKDSALACWRAKRDPELEITHLVNMVSEDGSHSRSHRLTAPLLQAQAEAMGLILVQRRASWEDYEREFKKALSDLRKEQVEAGIFGDIDLQEHRGWVERACAEAGMKALLPLWKESREELVEELISAGFKSKIVVTNAKFLGQEWLGSDIDRTFVRKIQALGGVDLCGENGEYHTYVYDGPLFHHPIRLCEGQKILHDGYGFLELTQSEKLKR